MSPSPRTPGPLAWALAAALLLAPAPAAAAPAQERRPSPELRAASVELGRVLRDSRARKLDDDACLARLAPVLARAPEACFEALASWRVPRVKASDPLQTLSEPQSELLLRALAAVEGRTVARRLEPWLAGREDAGARLAGVLALGAVGSAKDLPYLLELARSADGLPDRRREEAFEGALGAVLARDGRAMRAAGDLARSMGGQLFPAYLRALGRSGDPRALDLLDVALLVRPEHELLAMAQVRLLPPAQDPEVARRIAARLQQHLDPDRVQNCRAAAFALGQLEDASSAPRLVELLASGDRGVRDAAHWALRRIGGVSFPLDAAHWRQWLRAEQQWFEQQRPRSLRALRADNPGEAARALRDLLGHPLFRHELAEDLGRTLGGRRGPQEVAVCGALGQLGSLRAAAPLLALLEHHDAELAAAAHAALQACAGLELPRETRACRALLAPHGDTL